MRNTERGSNNFSLSLEFILVIFMEEIDQKVQDSVSKALEGLDEQVASAVNKALENLAPNAKQGDVNDEGKKLPPSVPGTSGSGEHAAFPHLG